MLALLATRALLPNARGLECSATPEEEEQMNSVFDALYEHLPRRQRGFIEEHTSMGFAGFLGVSYALSMKISIKEDEHLMVLLYGNVESNYSGMDNADYLLEEYKDACDTQHASGFMLDTETIIQNVTGDYFALIHDRVSDKLIIIRGGASSDLSMNHLYWGTHRDTKNIVFADDQDLVSRLCDQVHVFPLQHMCVFSPGEELKQALLVKKAASKKKIKSGLLKVESANNCIGLSHH
mmetsp:Transcript_5923/g.11559  ORF Transcript_5923/g.11559 Transcript_5923/m.11559 type:complete len:237 (+) Transcript_5923:133-843(+)